MPSGNNYPLLASGCSLRLLEFPYIFNAAHDQLYQIDAEALEMLLRCDGTTTLDQVIRDFDDPEVIELINYMIDEHLLELSQRPVHRFLHVDQSPIPSLRYLLVHTTTRCNLQCKHCYLGENNKEDLSMDMFRSVVDEFRLMGGLKLMLSGGEPLLHPRIWDILEYLKHTDLRVVILSNGTLIHEETALRLKDLVHEVQVSIDGTTSHDELRGEGCLDRTLSAIKHLKAAGVDVSVASMITKRNLDEFQELERLVTELGVLQWSVDVPCKTGYLAGNPDWMADLDRAAEVFARYGFGEGAHQSTGRYTCGTHLCTIMPGGDIARCGFFGEEPVGNITTGLAPAWQRLCHEYLWDLDKLDCAACGIIEECHGGCRYRALHWGGSMFSPDPVLCLANDIDPTKFTKI